MAAFLKIDSLARGFFWDLEELCLLAGFEDLHMPRANTSQFYGPIQVERCVLRQAGTRKPVYFLKNGILSAPYLELTLAQYEAANQGRPTIDLVLNSARHLRAMTSVGVVARLAQVSQ